MLKLLHKFSTPITSIGPVRDSEDLLWASPVNVHECGSFEAARSKVSFFQIASSSLIPAQTDKRPLFVKKAENHSLNEWTDIVAFDINYSVFTAIRRDGHLIEGTFDAKDRTVTTSVALNMTKYDLKRKPVQLFKYSDKGIFIFFFDLDGNFKVQSWNKFLNAVTLDIVLYPKELSEEVPHIRQIYYLDSLTLLLVFTDKNEILYLKLSDHTCPSLDLRYTAGLDANRTNTILRYRRLTNQYIDGKDKSSESNRSSSVVAGELVMSEDGSIEPVVQTNVLQTNVLQSPDFNIARLMKFSDSDLALKITRLGYRLTPTIATKLLNMIYEVEKEQDKMIYYESARVIYLRQEKLQHLPKEQVLFTLNKLLSFQQNAQQEERQNKRPFILQCCKLLSHFDGQQSSSNALPLDVLPILVSEFDANKCWMMDACNLLIDVHFRSILSNPDMLAQLQQLRNLVRESQQVRETEARLRGMINAFALAPESKQKSKTSAIELVNF